MEQALDQISTRQITVRAKRTLLQKMHIALKETAETEYWLKLLKMSEYITEDMGNSLLGDCLEIKRMLIASINTAKENNL